MKVLIGDAAYADLEQIYDWIRQDRPTAATSAIERIFDSLDRLAVFPFMGHPGRATGTFEWVVPRLPFILVYEIDQAEGELRVVAVFHGRQDPDLED